MSRFGRLSFTLPMVSVNSFSISQRNWFARIFEIVEEFDMKFWEFYESRRCDAQICRKRVIYIHGLPSVRASPSAASARTAGVVTAK